MMNGIGKVLSKMGIRPSATETRENRLPTSLQQYDKAESVEMGNRRFWNMLVCNVERSGYVPPRNRQTVVLNLACGKFREGPVLEAFFGNEQYGCASGRVKLFGIDNDPKKIIDAQVCNRPQHLIVCGDAAHLERYPQMPAEADVVLVRQQQYIANHQLWMIIFQQALQRVSPDGIVIITSYTGYEHEQLLLVLAGLGGRIVLEGRNSHALPLGTDKHLLDRNLVIMRRKE